MKKIITQEEAIRLGLSRYFTGEPCKNGHKGERYTIGKTCITCHQLHKKTPQSRQQQSLYRLINKKRNNERISQWAKANRKRLQDNRRRREFNIAPEQYNAMLVAQNYLCALCGAKLDLANRTHIDHCHTTGKCRSILCQNCNTGIGLLRDSPELLRLAASYLEYWKAQHVHSISLSN